VSIDEVHWLDASDLQASARRYRAGELDWTLLNRETLPWAKANDPAEILSVPANSNSFLFFNMTKGVLAEKPDVRRAINLALDRETLVTKIDPRGAPPAYGIVPPVIPGYTGQTLQFEGKPLASMPLADRVAAAKTLMATAGYGPANPLKLTVSYPTSEGARQILLGLRQMLLPIGIEFELDNMEWQVFVGHTNQRDFELGLMATAGEYPDFEAALGNFWSGSGIYNFTGYHSAEFDQQYERAMIEMDEPARRRLVEDCERIVLQDQPTAPLEFGTNLFLVSPRLSGFLGNLRFPKSRYLSFKP
jgi:oligopeptide transport system substrate-binding protein